MRDSAVSMISPQSPKKFFSQILWEILGENPYFWEILGENPYFWEILGENPYFWENLGENPYFWEIKTMFS